MCQLCDNQLSLMTDQFNDTLAQYRECYDAGRLRDTLAKRVHDLAESHVEISEQEMGATIISWYLAIAMERLMALESAGITT